MGATAALVFTAVGTGTQVAGQLQQGRAASRQAEAEARAAESTAQLLEQRAGVSTQRASEALAGGAAQESDFRSQIRQLFGSQRAGIAGQNVSLTVGSPQDVTSETLRMGELDALRIRTNATQVSSAYLAEAADYRKQAENARQGGAYAREAGDAAMTGAAIGAGATVIGGASEWLSQRYGLSRTARRARPPLPSRTTASPVASTYVVGGG